MVQIHQDIEALLGREIGSLSAMAGGDLSAVWRIDLADGTALVAKQGDMVIREADMLRAIARAGAPCPEVVAASGALLIMSLCPGRSGVVASWADLAQVLHRLWAGGEAPYGWSADYAFADVALPNAAQSDWPEFWAANRLLCHVPYLPADLARRIEALVQRMPEILPGNPLPALLHGDLWGGNVMSDAGTVTALIDPACYFGDREVDLAMLTLFDHPPEAFFDALELAPGWRDRLPAYRLFPLIVHCRLFGSAYRSALESELAKLGA